MPSANAPSSSAGATATDFRNPSTSVNQSRTNRMSRSSSVGARTRCCSPRRPVSTPTLVSGRYASYAADGCPVRVDYSSDACRSFESRSLRSTRPSVTLAATPTSSSALVAARRRAGARTSSVPRDGADRLPGRGPRAAGVVRRRVAGRAGEAGGRLAAEGLGDIAVVVGYLDADDRRSRPRPTGRTRQRPPQNAAARPLRRARRRPVRQAPPAQLRRVRRVPLLRPRRPRSACSGCTASTSR